MGTLFVRASGTVAAGLVGAAAQAEVVAYDSTRPSLFGIEVINDYGTRYEPNSRVETPGGVESDAQTCDIVTLAGSGRMVTQFETRFARILAFSTVKSLTATLTLYSLVGETPDQVIWSGQLSGAFTASGATKESISLNYTPNVVVPDTFAFAIAIDNFTNEANSAVGIRYSISAPTVGTSPDFVLLQDSASLAWRHEDASVHNLEAKIWTVPGPGAAGLVGLGGAAMLRRRPRGGGCR